MIKQSVCQKKEPLKYESCTHHIECDKQYPHKFFLTDIATQKLLMYDTAVQIRKWLTRRNIVPDKVYGYELIKEKPVHNSSDTDYESNYFSKRIHK